MPIPALAGFDSDIALTMTPKNPAKPPKKSRRLILDRSSYVPIYFINLANKYSRGASKIYLKLFGVGIIEWRILSVLSIEGNLSANIICERIDLDKAAASRSVQVLEDRGLITTEVDKDDTRKRLLHITDAGQVLHDKILTIALLRQERLLSGFSKDETAFLLSLLKRLSANSEIIDNFDYSALIDRK